MDQSICGSPEHRGPALGRVAAGGGGLHRGPAAGKTVRRPGGPDRRAGRRGPGKVRFQPAGQAPAQKRAPAAAGGLCRRVLPGAAAVGGGVGVHRHPVRGAGRAELYDGGDHHRDGGGVGGAALCAGDPQRQRGRKADRHDPHHRLPGAGGGPAGAAHGRDRGGRHRPPVGGGHDPGRPAHPAGQGPVHQPVGPDRRERACGKDRRAGGPGGGGPARDRGGLPGLPGQHRHQRQRPGGVGSRGGWDHVRLHRPHHGRQAPQDRV